MLSTGLFDTRLCVKFYGCVLKTKYFIPILLFKIVGLSHFSFLPLNDGSIRILQAFSERYVIMFICILEILLFLSIAKYWHLKGMLQYSSWFFLKTYVKIDILVLFAFFLLSKWWRSIMLSGSINQISDVIYMYDNSFSTISIYLILIQKQNFTTLHYLFCTLFCNEKSAIIVNARFQNATKYHFWRIIYINNVDFPFHVFHL